MTEYNRYINFKILHNTPQDFIDFCVNLWKTTKDQAMNGEGGHEIYVDDHVEKMIAFNNEELNARFEKIFGLKAWGSMWLTSHANVGQLPVHIDSDRPVGLNIPISVDLNNSCFYMSNQECTRRDLYPEEYLNCNPEKAVRFEYEPERYDWYNVEKPVLLNAWAAHGYFNYADEIRVMLSISVEGLYEEVLAKLNPEVYAQFNIKYIVHKAN